MFTEALPMVGSGLKTLYLVCLLPGTPTCCEKAVQNLKSNIVCARSYSHFVRFSVYGVFHAGSGHPTVVMHVAQRNLLLIGLASTSGSLDCWSYFGLAHTFIANMTGNTVLLGFALANAQWAAAAGAGSAILSYVGGVFAGAILARPIRRAVQTAPQHGAPPTQAPWPKRLTELLCFEWLLLLLAVLVDQARTPSESSSLAHSLVCLCAFAVGVQSAAITALQVQGVATTYITGTWTSAITELAQWITPKADQARKADRRAGALRGFGLQGTVLTAYLAAAAGSGACFHAGWRMRMGVLPAALLLLVVAGGLVWGDPAARRP